MDSKEFSISDFKKGKEEAISWLVQKYKKALYEIAFKITQNEKTAMQVVHETFYELKALRNTLHNLSEIEQILKDFTKESAKKKSSARKG